jgi:predicted nucleotidyltransferase
MNRSDVFKKIDQHRDELKSRYAISSLSLFGSVARDQATSNSDLDILVSFEETPGLFKFLELKSRLETICQCPVDLVTEKALKKQFREQILKEALDAI